MKKLFGFVAISLFVCGAGLAASRSASADGHCNKINARLIADIVTDGCTSPVGLCTRGAMIGAGPLNGTTAFSGDSVSYAGGMPDTVPLTTLGYDGTYLITTDHGTVTFKDTGLFDTVNGRFASISTLVGGTGRFAGATGTAYTHGVGTSHLEAQVDGEICYP